jgi:catalase
MPKVLTKKIKPEVVQSKALSLLARPGDGTIRARRVAIIVADGVAGAEVDALAERLAAEGAVPITLGARLGRVKSDRGKPIEIGAPIDAAPAVVFDAMVLPDGEAAAAALATNGRVLEFLKDQYRHCKPILVLGASKQILEAAGVPATLPSGKPDPGLIIAKGGEAADAFIKAIAQHRHYERETDPPLV